MLPCLDRSVLTSHALMLPVPLRISVFDKEQVIPLWQEMKLARKQFDWLGSMSLRLKKGSLFMKLARKQFDYKFRLPEPRSMGGPHEILPRSDNYEIPPWGPRSAGSHASTIPPWVPRRWIPAPRMTITNHEPWSPRSDDSYVDPYDFTDHEAEYDDDDDDV